LPFLLFSKNLKIKIILPVVSCGCGIWSLTVREEHRLRVFENRVLRRIFSLKREEVAEGLSSFITLTLHESFLV
jgi:hypothetical protein